MECSECPGTHFSTLDSYRAHIMTVHRPEQHECHACGKTYPRRILLEKHLAVCRRVESMNLNVALGRIRPVCMELVQNPTASLLQHLAREMNLFDVQIVQDLDQFLVFPLRCTLAAYLRKMLSEQVLIEACHALDILLVKAKHHQPIICIDVYSLLTDILYNAGDSERRPLSEEEKETVIHTLCTLIRLAENGFLVELYSIFNFPKLGSIVSHLIGIAGETNSSRSLQLSAMDGLLVLMQKGTDFGQQQLGVLGSRFGGLLPGVSSCMLKIIKGDEKQGHRVITKALTVWSEVVCLTLNDDTLAEEQASDGVWKDLGAVSDRLKILIVERSEEWLMSVVPRLEFMVKEISTLKKHDHWRVRLTLIESVNDILTLCSSSLKSCVPVLLEVLVLLMTDPFGPVAKSAKSALKAFRDRHHGLDSCIPLVDLLKENLFAIVTAFPRIMKMEEDSEKLAMAGSLLNYISLLGKNLSAMLLSLPHATRLVQVLVHALDLDCSDQKILEESGVGAQGTTDITKFVQRAMIMKPKKVFLHFRDEAVRETLMGVCYHLGYYGDLGILVECILDMYRQSEKHQLSCILVINQMVSGSKGVDDPEIIFPGATGRQRTFQDDNDDPEMEFQYAADPQAASLCMNDEELESMNVDDTEMSSLPEDNPDTVSPNVADPNAASPDVGDSSSASPNQKVPEVVLPPLTDSNAAFPEIDDSASTSLDQEVPVVVSPPLTDSETASLDQEVPEVLSPPLTDSEAATSDASDTASASPDQKVPEVVFPPLTDSEATSSDFGDSASTSPDQKIPEVVSPPLTDSEAASSDFGDSASALLSQEVPEVVPPHVANPEAVSPDVDGLETASQGVDDPGTESPDSGSSPPREIISMLLDEYLSLSNMTLTESTSRRFPSASSACRQPLMSLSVVEMSESKTTICLRTIPVPQQPARNKRQRDVMLTCLFLEGVGMFAKVMGEDFEPMLADILCLLAEKVGSEISAVSSSAYLALVDVCEACCYMSLDELIQKNADYIVNSISLQLRQFPRYPRAPTILSVVIQFCETDILPLIWDSIMEILDTLDDNYSEQALLLLPVLHQLTLAISRWFPMKTTQENPSGETSHRLTGPTPCPELDAVRLNAFLLERHRLRIEAEAFEDDEEAGKEILDSAAIEADALRTEEETLEGERRAEEEEAKREPPLHIKALKEILSRTKHLLILPNTQISLLTLDIVKQGCRDLAIHENELLPLVHHMWPAFKQRFLDPDKVVVIKAVNTLQALCLDCGDFLKKRVERDVLPLLQAFLDREASTSEETGVSFRFTMTFKLQVAVLSAVGDIASWTRLNGPPLESLIYSCLPYLHRLQPKKLQELSKLSIKKFAACNADMVWLCLGSLYSSDVPEPPSYCFVPLTSFPNVGLRNDYTDNVSELKEFLESDMMDG